MAGADLDALLKQPGDKEDQGCTGGGEDLLHNDGLIPDGLHNGLVQGCQGPEGCDGAAGVRHLPYVLPQGQLPGINEQRPRADVPLH